MDAIEFLKTAQRRAKTNPSYYGNSIVLTNPTNEEVWKQFVNQVENWGKEHPVQTRMSKFLEVYPDAPLAEDGLPVVAPCDINKNWQKILEKENCEGACDYCRKDFWLQEVE